MSFDFIDTQGDDVAEIEGPADTLKRAFGSIINVGETKLFVDDERLRTQYVNSANVMMGVLNVPAEALETYNVEQESVVATNIDRLNNSLRPARVTKTDEIRLSIKQRQMDTYVDRQYDDSVSSEFHNVWKLLDPDSVRQEPIIPDLEEHLEVIDVDLQQLHDAVSSVGNPYKHTEFKSTDDGLRLRGNDSTHGTEVTIHGEVPDGIHALYSNDYLTDIADAVKSLQADDVTLKIGEEFPIKVKWARDDGVNGEYMLAPRIQSE